MIVQEVRRNKIINEHRKDRELKWNTRQQFIRDKKAQIRQNRQDKLAIIKKQKQDWLDKKKAKKQDMLNQKMFNMIETIKNHPSQKQVIRKKI